MACKHQADWAFVTLLSVTGFLLLNCSSSTGEDNPDTGAPDIHDAGVADTLDANGDGSTSGPLGVFMIWDKIAETKELDVQRIRAGVYRFTSGEAQKFQIFLKAYQNAELEPVLYMTPNSEVWGNAVIGNIDFSNIPAGDGISGVPSDVTAYKKELGLFVESLDGDGNADLPGLKRPVRYIQVGNEVYWQWCGAPPATITTPAGLLAWRDNNALQVAQSYGEFLKVTYQTIKQVAPNISVILGTVVDPGKGLTASSNLIMTQYQQYYDIVDLHFYGDHVQAAAFLSQIGPVFALKKPVWGLEVGGPMANYSAQHHTQQVVKLPIVLFAAGFDWIFWSSLTPTVGWPPSFLNTALLEVSSYAKKPAYYTYKVFVDKLKGCTSATRLNTTDEVYKVQCPDGRSLFVLWTNTGQEKTFDLSGWTGDKTVTVTHTITASGQTSPTKQQVPATAIPIGADPIFVE